MIEPITNQAVLQALDRAVEQVRRNLPSFTFSSQNHSSSQGVYASCANDDWTNGFWPGQIWLAYERSRDPVLRYAGLIQAELFHRRIRDKVVVDHHDMGFLYTPSCVAAWKLTGDARAGQAAVLAADQMMTRYQSVGRFFQAWGAMDQAENYRYIIDCLLNLPLLYWASQVTGDRRYRDAALAHTDTCLNHSFRPDGSTHHTFYLDPKTGAGLRGVTCQGYSNDSAWARGQAWAIYGMALSYRHTGDERCLDTFRRVLEYYLGRLPEDLVPYWDLIFTDGSQEPRDSSSAAIAACGLLEMAPRLPKQEGQKCALLARQMVASLVSSYAVTPGGGSNGLLLHGTYSRKTPYNTCIPAGVDECVIWGDYFYMEALTRLAGDWDPYW